MPLLGGLFARRTPSRHAHSTATESVASCSTSNQDSTDGDYVLPGKPPQPIYNLPAAGSSGKLRLPFRRRPLPPRVDPNDPRRPVVSLNDAPSPPRFSSVTSDPGHDLVPPRKSSLFGAHNESLPSLPTASSLTHLHSDPPRPSSFDVLSNAHSPPAGQGQPHKKSPGLFSWARERTKSKPLPPTSTASSASSAGPSADSPSSFNLKSFRHVRPDSPPSLPVTPSPPPAHSLAPPRPRPREDSAASSDSSQRISIAAFREAQARSRANSPVPSFRPPSTADTLRVDGNNRKRASTVSVVSAAERSQPNNAVAAAPIPSRRPDSAAVESSSDDPESEDDEEVDSDGKQIPIIPGRKQTITRRADGAHTRSDAGHGALPTSMGKLSLLRQDPRQSRLAPPPTHQAPYTRPRASYSTSALTPSSEARSASILAGATSSSSSNAHPKGVTPKSKDESDESTDSSDADSEDMPLSDLVPPRRPGSSASNLSNTRSRMPGKPLIDIKSLAGGPPLLTPILRHEDSVKDLVQPKEQAVERDQPFSIPAVLAHSSSTSPPISPSISKPNTTSVDKPASSAHHRRSSTDVPVPKEPENDDDLMINAIRLVGALDKELEQPRETSKPSDMSRSDRIVPTPIRAREPPTSFTVLSRPPQRRSAAEPLMPLSPTLQTPPNSAPPALSRHPETGTRQRAPTMPPSQNDKSDAVSVSSAARSSTSRSSSRIPPVPLIHSIPDSPSVKEEYKPGRPRSSSRISAVKPSETRSRPPPTVATSTSTSTKTPSRHSQPSSIPQRPFVSNSSVRGGSPAGSSTGDSSSGRSPFTPRDGSDIGTRSKDDASDVGSTLKARGHAKKPSVTFEDMPPARGRERTKSDLTDEQKTRERRRSEAKAAIELGKIVNGRGPLVHDDSDEDTRLRNRNPTINVTMEHGGPGVMPGWGGPWQQPMGTGVPMVPPQFGNDPAYLAAHQRALLIAKQAYQMAVAQQAMQMAGEEWERGSNIGFGGGGSVYGGGSGGSVYGGGTGGSVYGGGSGGSVYGGMGGGMVPMGMMGMPNMGMLMPPNQWGRSSVAFPSATASVYGGISSSQSEFGGTRNWDTRSVYGDSFGPSSSRGGAPSSSTSAQGGNARPRARTGVSAPSPSATSQSRTPGVARNRAAAPPSSWKNGR